MNDNILIKGAREHNLKNIDVEIPRNRLVVFTGLSGSGKSSICIDTLFAEGQRRYVESLSSYARQFLMRMDKPAVDYIKGISPAIAIEQKTSSGQARSTVGTMTELYDYLRLLYARIGKTYSPVSGRVVSKQEVRDVVDFILQLPEESKLMILAKVRPHKDIKSELKLLLQKGFSRIIWDGAMREITELSEKEIKASYSDYIELLIDRVSAGRSDENKSRLADSVSSAFTESLGECIVELQAGERHSFSNRFEADGILFEEPNQQLFNFNSPYGACKRCEGFGTIIGVDEDLVFPDKSLSVYEDAVACWKGEKMQEWKQLLVKNAWRFDFPVHRSIRDLSEEEYQLLWTGNEYFRGLNEFFRHLEEQSYKIQYRVLMSRYRGRTRCDECLGSRLRKDASYVKIGDRSISELLLMPVKEVQQFFSKLKLSPTETAIAKRILLELNNRLQVMMDIGLGYLNLNRLSNTLSGGETQRIHLTRSLGSNLSSSMYILDEPSIGLHSRDTERLIGVLKNLRDLGNTVILVEHDEDIMRSADHLVDVGPDAGRFGGEIVYAGHPDEIGKQKRGYTGKYLSGQEEIALPTVRRKAINHIVLEGVSQHNLKNIDVKIPLNNLVVVSGVSGSGKTTLIKKVLYPALKREFDGYGEKPGKFKNLGGDIKRLHNVELIDQHPLGRSSRSNPVTYVKAYDAIRELFAEQQLSKVRGYKPKHFSFNVEGGRCEVCKGDGQILVEMQFLADIHLVCDSCHGKRFKSDVLEVQYKGKNISEVLDLSIDDALEFFNKQRDVHERIKPLQDVGLGYIKMGQPSSTLSGGEAQRVKLASYLGKGNVHEPMLFIFDEPTTGLHFHDIKKLLNAFDMLIQNGHSVIVIEHHLDVIKCADHLIELGPDGGEEGGYLLHSGAVMDLLKVKKSPTARFLKNKLK